MAAASAPSSALPALDAKHALSQQRMAQALEGLEVRSGVLRVANPAPQSPAKATALLAQAQATLAENSWFVSCAAYARALRAAPASADAFEGYASAAMLDAKTDLAEAALRAALQLDPSRLGARYRLAEIRQMDGDYAGARREWGQVVQADPGYRDTQARLATAAYFDGDLAEARRRSDEARRRRQTLPPQFEPLLAEAEREGRP